MRLIAILLVCAAFSAATLVSDVPMFAWSGKEYLGGKSTVSASVTPKSVQSFLQSVVKHREMASPFSNKAQIPTPEVLVVVLESQLRLDEMSVYSVQLPALKKMMQDASSSIFVPHVDLQEALTGNIVKVSSSVSGSVIYAGKGATLLPQLKRTVPSIQEVTIARLEYVLQGSNIFHNGVTDLLIVHLETATPLEKFDHTNQVLQHLYDVVSSQTKDYVFVYTGISYGGAKWVNNFDTIKRSYSSFQDYVLEDSAQANATNGTKPNWFQEFFPGWFWEVTVPFMFLVPIILAGYCQLMSVQAPEQFVPKKKKLH